RANSASSPRNVSTAASATSKAFAARSKPGSQTATKTKPRPIGSSQPTTPESNSRRSTRSFPVKMDESRHYALLAIFPFIAAMVAIYSLFADPSTIGSHLESVSYVLPASAISVIGDQIGRIAAQGRTTLGVATIASLAVALWSANAGMKAIFDALNIVYQEEEKRGFFKLNAVSLGFTISAAVLAIVAIAAVVAMPPLISFLGLPQNIQEWMNWLRWPLLLLVVALAASVIY